MDRPEKQAALTKLRDLQGAGTSPLAVIFAMMIENRPVGQDFLSAALQRNRKTIRKAINFLVAEGHIERVHRYAWALPGGQLSLPGFNVGILPADAGRVNTTLPDAGRVESALPALTTTTCREGVEIDVVVSKDAGRVNNTLPEPERVNNTLSPHLTTALRAAGIGQNAWRSLAEYDHITAEYVTAHTAARRQGLGIYADPRKRNTGFQIHCMKAEDLAPQDPKAVPVASPYGVPCPECGCTVDESYLCPECGACWVTERRHCCTCELVDD